MKWRDVADGIEGAEPGRLYRSVDDSQTGLWRVCVENPNAPRDRWTWGVWDFRRKSQDGVRPRPIKVGQGFAALWQAIAYANTYAASRPLRALLAGLRVVRLVGAAMREEWHA